MPAYLSPNDVVVVSAESVASTEPRPILQSNIGFVNALFGELLRASEISRDALTSYYVDYYFAQVMNGGFSQFVYNSEWKPEAVSLVREGLQAIGASEHEALFAEGELLVTKRPSRLKAFFSSMYFGKNAERDRLDGISNRIVSLDEHENLEQLNAAWLRSRPSLLVVPEQHLKAQIGLRAEAITDREARKAASLAAEPRYMKVIRALCQAAGHTLTRVTAGDPTNMHEGKPVLAWHFITDKGHHCMVDLGTKAIMFTGTSRERIIEIPVERDAT